MKSYKQLQNEFSARKSHLRATARQELKDGLAQCTEGQQHLFKQMYAKGNLELTTDEIVDSLDWEKIDWAMQQVQRTLEKAREQRE